MTGERHRTGLGPSTVWAQGQIFTRDWLSFMSPQVPDRPLSTTDRRKRLDHVRPHPPCRARIPQVTAVAAVFQGHGVFSLVPMAPRPLRPLEGASEG